MEQSGEDLSWLSPLEGQGAQYHHYHRRGSAGGGVVHVAAPVKSDASFQQAAQQTAHASCNASSFSSRRPTVPVVPVVPAGSFAGSFMHHGCAAPPPSAGVHVPAACGGGVGASTHSTPGGAPQWFVNADGASIPVVQPLNLPANTFPTQNIPVAAAFPSWHWHGGAAASLAPGSAGVAAAAGGFACGPGTPGTCPGDRMSGASSCIGGAPIPTPAGSGISAGSSTPAASVPMASPVPLSSGGSGGSHGSPALRTTVKILEALTKVEVPPPADIPIGPFPGEDLVSHHIKSWADDPSKGGGAFNISSNGKRPQGYPRLRFKCSDCVKFSKMLWAAEYQQGVEGWVLSNGTFKHNHALLQDEAVLRASSGGHKGGNMHPDVVSLGTLLAEAGMSASQIIPALEEKNKQLGIEIGTLTYPIVYERFIRHSAAERMLDTQGLMEMLQKRVSCQSACVLVHARACTCALVC